MFLLFLYCVPSHSGQAEFLLDGYDVPFLNILGNSTNTILTDKVIGIWLEHQDSPNGIPANTSAGGEITFGGLNPARYTGDITYINCVGAAFGTPWTVSVGVFLVDLIACGRTMPKL